MADEALQHPHDHSQVDVPELVEEDPFHDAAGNRLFQRNELVEMTEFGAQCWDAGVDPDEVAVYLRAVDGSTPA